MASKLTHLEACKLVEDSLERVSKTLAYIRLKLDKPYSDGSPRQLSLFDENAIEHANLLCNINWYGAYIAGARAMFQALKNNDYLDIPRPKGERKQTVADTIANKAQLDLYMENSRNLDWFLHGFPKGVEVITEFERDKNGKVIGAKASFYKRSMEIQKI